MTDAPTLKPCPFCGGEATYRVGHTTEHVDSISCRQCDFYMSDQGIVQGSVRDTWNRRALPLPDDAEMVERVARALLVSEPEAYANSQELLDEHFEWWRAGRDDPESCVHYSSIGIAIRQARAALSAMRGEP